MDAARELIQRVETALRYPADDPHSTMIVVLIVITAAVLAALVLIALAIPSRQRSEADKVDSEAPDDSFYDPNAEEESPKPQEG